MCLCGTGEKDGEDRGGFNRPCPTDPENGDEPHSVNNSLDFSTFSLIGKKGQPTGRQKIGRSPK